MIWSFIYIAAVLIANYTAVWFIPMPGFGAVALGTLFFGVTFTARDYVHHLGRRYVYTMIAITALSSAALSVAGSVDWRIVAASVIAIILSETADTEVYHRLLSHSWPVRVASSNMVSVPLDTVFFNALAFVGVLPGALLVEIMIGEIIIKYVIGILTGLWRYLSLSIAPMETGALQKSQ